MTGIFTTTIALIIWVGIIEATYTGIERNLLKAQPRLYGVYAQIAAGTAFAAVLGAALVWVLTRI